MYIGVCSMQNYKDSKEKPLNNFTLVHLLFLMRSPKKRRGHCVKCPLA